MTDGLGDGRYLLDNSVFQRIDHPKVKPLWRQGVEADRLYACGPFVTEALFSARGPVQHTELRALLTEGLAWAEVDDETWALAAEASARMAQHATLFHRRPMVHYLLAAAAHQHGLGVLHYDADYDRLAECSGLQFESGWVAEPGSLDAGSPDHLRPLRRAIGDRLGQFTAGEDEAVLRRVVDMLDKELEATGKPALPAPEL